MENKIKVLFLTKYTSMGASSRYRFYNYKEYLKENNIDPIYKPLFGDNYLMHLYKGNKIRKILWAFYYIIQRIIFLFFHAKKYKHAVIEAELFPHFGFKFDYFFLKKMKSFSLDFDDNISANYQDTVKKNKIPKLMKLANFVTVGNHWYFSEFEGNLIYLPTVIDLDQYPLHNLEKQNDVPVIVWIGSLSTQKYILLIEDVLTEISTDYKFKLKIIGGKIKLNSNINVEYVEWKKETENSELAFSDIGIMPLEKSYWEMGKCGFKLIQYMASGVSVIATDVPANKEIIGDNISGFTVQDKIEWKTNIITLLENTELRNKMGFDGRKVIEGRYTYQIWGAKYSDIIKNNM